jgi:superfamily II DNA or RNA helicase
MNTGLNVYPDIDDEINFYNSINNKKEYSDFKSQNKKNYNCIENHQRLLANFINPLTQYNSILIFHNVGLGKTLSAITIAENFKKDYKIVVLTRNRLLEYNFKNELLYTCSNYLEKDGDITEAKKQINKHYSFITESSILFCLA